MRGRRAAHPAAPTPPPSPAATYPNPVAHCAGVHAVASFATDTAQHHHHHTPATTTPTPTLPQRNCRAHHRHTNQTLKHASRDVAGVLDVTPHAHATPAAAAATATATNVPRTISFSCPRTLLSYSFARRPATFWLACKGGGSGGQEDAFRGEGGQHSVP